MNGVPQNPREEMVAELEGYGFDTIPDVPVNWRAVFTDAELRSAIRRMTEDGAPEIDEMVEAIRALVDAADRRAVNGLTTAIETQRRLLARADRYLESSHAN